MAFNYSKMGMRIQNARNLRGMSISELAERTYFTAKSIALVEAGQAEINMPLFAALCTALKVTPNDLLEGEFPSTGGRSLKEEALLKEMQDLIAEIKGVPDDGIVLRDPETVVHEIRDMLRAEKEKSPDKKSSSTTRPRYFR